MEGKISRNEKVLRRGEWKTRGITCIIAMIQVTTLSYDICWYGASLWQSQTEMYRDRSRTCSAHLSV